jgi:hypothetical protein
MESNQPSSTPRKNLDRSYKTSFLFTPLFGSNSNNDVDALNNRKLKELEGTAFQFKSEDDASLSDRYANESDEEKTKMLDHLREILHHCPAPAQLFLKFNAQVMLLRNMSSSLVNGSRGVVVGFSSR